MDLTEMTGNENRHPWELSRARCILNVIKKYRLDSVADIGAGDMFFTLRLKPFVSGELYAVDSGYGGRHETTGGIRCLNDISGLPELGGRCGLILMDVLEHVKEDGAFLKGALDKIPVGGFAFITVPAFRFLFSAHDAFLKHYRRYDRKRLLALTGAYMGAAGENLRVVECRYFYATLFFARLAGLPFQNRGKNAQTGVGAWRLGPKHPVTRLICAALNIDFRVCGFLAKMRIYLPGLSLLAVCEKTGAGSGRGR
jgi:hypothetical protein